MATLRTAGSLQVIKWLNPATLVYHLWMRRNLIIQFTRREIEGRYRGSFLGMIWSLANPLFMLAIYTFVFGLVLKSRWPTARSDSLGEFALIVFAGLIPFNLFSDCITRAPALIVGVPNYVKKVVFPLEILPVSIMGSALFHMLISVGVLLVAELILFGSVPWTVVLLPVVVLPAIFLGLGLMWFLSSLGVYIRDIGQVVGLVVQALFFFTPIFYSLDIIPEPFKTVILYNPMASVVENFRRVLVLEGQPSWLGLCYWLLGTGTVMVLGYAWFWITKKAFADVI
jgi:lipopolysaccharide transport system permease protein